MPRRRVLTDEQLSSLLALPRDEADLVRHYTLSRADTQAASCARARRSRRRPYASSPTSSASRRPTRSRPTPPACRPAASSSTTCARRSASWPSRPSTAASSSAGSCPWPFATTSGLAIAQALMDELRRRQIIAPGPSVIERLVAAALFRAERHVAGQLTQGLSSEQASALDALLELRPDAPHLSVLSWARQPPGAANHRSLARVIEQRAQLRALRLDPACAEAVHPERLRQLAREGARLTAQHLRALSEARRRATWSPAMPSIR